MRDGECRSSSGISREVMLASSAQWPWASYLRHAQLSVGTTLRFSDLRSASYLMAGLCQWQDQILDQNWLASCVVSGTTIYRDPQFSALFKPGQMQRLRQAQRQLAT